MAYSARSSCSTVSRAPLTPIRIYVRACVHECNRARRYVRARVLLRVSPAMPGQIPRVHRVIQRKVLRCVMLPVSGRVRASLPLRLCAPPLDPRRSVGQAGERDGPRRRTVRIPTACQVFPGWRWGARGSGNYRRTAARKRLRRGARTRSAGKRWNQNAFSKWQRHCSGCCQCVLLLVYALFQFLNLSSVRSSLRPFLWLLESTVGIDAVQGDWLTQKFTATHPRITADSRSQPRGT